MSRDRPLLLVWATALALMASGGLATASAGAHSPLTRHFPLGTRTLCCSARAHPPHTSARSRTRSAHTTTRAVGGARTTSASRTATSGANPARPPHHDGGIPEIVYLGVPPLLAIMAILGQLLVARWLRRRHPAAAESAA